MVVIFGALCRKAIQLIEKGLHPSVIIDGYHLACEYAKEQLVNISEIQSKVPNSFIVCLHFTNSYVRI